MSLVAIVVVLHTIKVMPLTGVAGSPNCYYTKRRNHPKIKRNLTNTQHKRKLRSPDPKYHNDPKANFLPPRKNEPRVDMPKPVIRTFHRRLQILHVDGQRQVTDGRPDRGAFTHWGPGGACKWAIKILNVSCFVSLLNWLICWLV